MDKAAELLVIITSSVLVIFLIALIVAIVKVITLINSLKRISEKAEKIAESAEAVGNFFEHASGPAVLGKFFYNVSQHVFEHSKKGKKGN